MESSQYSLISAAPPINMDTHSNYLNDGKYTNLPNNNISIEINDDEKLKNIQKQKKENAKILECIEEIIKDTNSVNNTEEDDKSINNNIQDNIIIENEKDKKMQFNEVKEVNIQFNSDKNIRYEQEIEKENDSNNNNNGKKKSKSLKQKRNKRNTLTVNPNLRNQDLEDSNDIISMHGVYYKKKDNENRNIKNINNNNNNNNKRYNVNNNKNIQINKSHDNNSCFTFFNNSYGFSLLMIFIRNIIFLGAFLFFFVENESLYFKFIITPEIFLIGCILGGFFFLLAKIIQHKTDSYELSSPFFLWIGISSFKAVFYFGIWSILKDNNYINIKNQPFIFNDYFQINATKVYIIYFSFSIIYFFTLSLSLFFDTKVSFFNFYTLGLIYVGLAIIISFLIENDILIYVIIFCLLGFILFNIGFGICYCKDVINNMNFVWNTLLIEINSIYPILAIISIPSIIISTIFYCIYAICSRKKKID